MKTVDRITERALALANSTVNTYSPTPETPTMCPCVKAHGTPQHLAKDHAIYVKGDRR